MVAGTKIRGVPIQLPGWWLERANDLASKQSGWTQERLAAALSRIVQRELPWDHKAVGNFLKGNHMTVEMMDAFCLLFDELPPCQLPAHNYEAALRMLVISRDSEPEAVRVQRFAAVDRALDERRRATEDQIRRLSSANEARRGTGERPRGVDRGGPPARRSRS